MSVLKEITLRLKQFQWLTFFAIVSVSVTSAVIILLSYKLTEILAAPEWCVRAINAEKLAKARDVSAVGDCVSLMTIQLKALATNSHIYAGTMALALLVLVVVVIAKARLDLEVAKGSAKVGIGHDNGTKPTPAQAAAATADAAVDKAEAIAAQTSPTTNPAGEEL